MFSRLREGPDTPPGTVIYRAKGFDSDGDQLTFGILNLKTADKSSADKFNNNNDLLEIVNEENSNEANVVLRRFLDAETESEHQLILTLTDDRLGAGNFITQSLLIVVEDINDNIPIFEPHIPSIQVSSNFLDMNWQKLAKKIKI